MHSIGHDSRTVCQHAANKFDDGKEKIKKETYDAVYAVAAEGLGKDERSTKFKSVKTDWIATLTEEEVENFEPEWNIVCVPSFMADPEVDGTRQHNFAILNFSQKIILI